MLGKCGGLRTVTSVGEAMSGGFDVRQQLVPLPLLKHAQQAFDFFRLRRIAQNAANLGQHLLIVQEIDSVPGREVGKVP